MTTSLSDWNDLAAVAGLAEVRSQLKHAAPVAGGLDAGAANDSWPDLTLRGLQPMPEIPCEILPPWLARMAAAVSASAQTPPALAVILCVAMLSTVLQRRFVVAPDGADYIETLSIWTAGLAATGTRKTAVLGPLQRPIRRWEKLTGDRMRQEVARVNSQRAVAKKTIERLLQDSAKAKEPEAREAIRAEIEREELAMPEEIRAPLLFVGEATAEALQGLLVDHRERMAVQSDESGVFMTMAGLYSNGQPNLDVFLQGYSGSPLRVHRTSRNAYVAHPAICMALLVQPGSLAELAGSRRFRESGLMARFLYVAPESNVGARDVRNRQPIPEDAAAEYERNVFSLLAGEPSPAMDPRVLKLDEAAREVWLDFSEEVERQQGPGGRYESICDWTCKLPGQSVRLAGLFELAANGLDSVQVGFDAMDRALRLARLLIPHAQKALGMLGADEADSDADAVLSWVRANKTEDFKRSEVHKALLWRFRKVDGLVRALERLESGGVLRSCKVANKGARPSHVYAVNPAIHR